MNLIEFIYDKLSIKILLLFGAESASTAVWMFSFLFLRLLCLSLGIWPSLALSVLFVFPFYIQKVIGWVPFAGNSHPLLPVRITEVLMGRSSAYHLTVVIPAHFIGCVVGAVAFGATINALNISPAKALAPFTQSSGLNAPPEIQSYELITILSWMHYFYQTYFNDALLMCLYIFIQISVPETLRVNKLPLWLISLFNLPVVIWDLGSLLTFNPCAVYALWFVTGRVDSLPLELIISPLIGAMLSSVLCSLVVPDSPRWKPTRLNQQVTLKE